MSLGEQPFRRTVTAEQTYRVLWERYHEGAVDALGGGVFTGRIASEVDATHSTVNKRVAELREAGHVERVRGMNPETRTPRGSYVPASGPPANVFGGDA